MVQLYSHKHPPTMKKQDTPVLNTAFETRTMPPLVWECNKIVNHGCHLHLYADDTQVYLHDCTTLPLYCWHCTVVQHEPATSEPGKDSTHLVGVVMAGRESWRPRCADHSDINKNGRQCTWPACCCRQSPDDDEACAWHVFSGLLPNPAVASLNMFAIVWCH